MNADPELNLTVERVIAAPRWRVWRAWTDRHADLGFADGWGTVVRQLADFVESEA